LADLSCLVLYPCRGKDERGDKPHADCQDGGTRQAQSSPPTRRTSPSAAGISFRHSGVGAAAGAPRTETMSPRRNAIPANSLRWCQPNRKIRHRKRPALRLNPSDRRRPASLRRKPRRISASANVSEFVRSTCISSRYFIPPPHSHAARCSRTPSDRSGTKLAPGNAGAAALAPERSALSWF